MASVNESIYSISDVQRAALDSDNDLLALLKSSKTAATSKAQYNNTPLFAAVSTDNLKGLQWYLANLSKALDYQNTLGYTPLFWAIDAGVQNNKTVIEAMLAKITDWSHTDTLGNNIMHLLVENLICQRPEAVMSLMRQIHQKDSGLMQQKNLAGMTPFEHAKNLNIDADQLHQLLANNPNMG